MTRDERIDQLVAESQAAQPDGCCAGPSWRGHLCQYHEGFSAGAEAAMRSFDEFNAHFVAPDPRSGRYRLK